MKDKAFSATAKRRTATKQPPPPFIYGAQYYRAPTPDPENWGNDLRRMHELGFNTIKFWVQWRWSERREGVYYWDDLDRLMNLAGQNGLQVTLNTILDVAPAWLFEKYPDAIMVEGSGHPCRLSPNVCRQLGGYPGPCYYHPGALAARQRFMTAAIRHFAPHPALAMWDVWNEPENNLVTRTPALATLLCYCPECQRQFRHYLQQRYGTLAALNLAWGRCYSDWQETEAPTDPDTIGDFLDWREFHLDKLTAEAEWRLAIVKQYDPTRVRYLHVVANAVNCFNAVTGVDDFELAKSCPVFGSTMCSGDVLACAQAVSAARGKVFYNAECHINYGETGMHPRVVDRTLFLKELVPQLGWGVYGFLFWQFRPETLGTEGPAWGLIRPDGSDRPITRVAEMFGRRILPLSKKLAACRPGVPPVGIWRGRRNEIFHFVADRQLNTLATGLRNYAETLYSLNLPFGAVGTRQLAEGNLAGVKMLVLVDPYCLEEAEARTLDAFVRNGGVIVTEAHLGAYNGTTCRHSRRTPGCGLAEFWKLYEAETTSAYHLPLANAGAVYDARGDVAKALSATGAAGAEYFPLTDCYGTSGWGARRFAVLAGDNLTVEAEFQGQPCMAVQTVGKGKVFYAGTLLGYAASRGRALLKAWLGRAAQSAGIVRTAVTDAVHVDILRDPQGEAQFAVLFNLTEKAQTLSLALPGTWRGVFDEQVVVTAEQELVIGASTSELYVRI